MANVQKVSVPEAAIHRACAELLTVLEIQGTLTFFHPANGIFLRGTKKQRDIEIGKMKRMGFKPGVNDLVLLFSGGRTAWIELKSETGTLDAAQKVWRDKLLALGHEWHLFRDVTELHAYLMAVKA